MNTQATFSERLKTWRKATGLSQEDAAARLDVSRSYLNQVEKGSRNAGRKLLSKFHDLQNAGNLALARQAIHGHDWERAFRHFVQGTDPASLIDRLRSLLADESVSIQERLRLAGMVLPVLGARVSELKREFEEAEATLSQTVGSRRIRVAS